MSQTPCLAAANPAASRRANASPPEKCPTGVDVPMQAGKRLSVGWRRNQRRRPSTPRIVASDPKSRRRRPTADLAKRLLNNCTPRRRSNSGRRRSPQCEVCSPYRAVRMNTRAKFGWRGQAGVRRLKIARGSLTTAAELGGASNHVPGRTTTRPQTPSRLTSRRYAGEPKLASRACSKLASRVLNYALILATQTPLSSWLTDAGRVPLVANRGDLRSTRWGAMVEVRDKTSGLVVSDCFEMGYALWWQSLPVRKQAALVAFLTATGTRRPTGRVFQSSATNRADIKRE